jgi:hypothetical protein
MIWILDAIYGGLEPQLWSYNITYTYDMDVGCILRGFGGPINRQNNKNTHQKPILASKMPTARGILA